MDQGHDIIDYYKNGLSVEEIAEITPFNVSAIASSIYFAVENGLI